MDRDKYILQQAQEFFDYFCDEVPPVYRDIGDLDATEDYEEVMAALGDNLATAAKYYIKRYDTQLIKEQIKALMNS